MIRNIRFAVAEMCDNPARAGIIRFSEFAMSQTLSLPILGLDETFPETLYVLHHPASNRYGCFCHEGIHGLAAFSMEQGAIRFAEWIDLVGMKTCEMTFDEAREVAKDRPMPVVSLMLLDSLQSPKIHFVR